MSSISRAVGYGAFALALLLAMAPSGAQTGRRSPTDEADAAEQRWSEYREVLQDPSPPRRMAALQGALEDSNPGVRANAVWFFLRPSQSLPIEVVTTPGGEPSPGDAPRTEVSSLRWDDNTRSFTGYTRSHGHNGPVEGRVIGAELHIRFLALGMPSSLGAGGGGAPRSSNPVKRSCQATLVPSTAKDALTGRMNCDGFPLTLPLRLPLG